MNKRILIAALSAATLSLSCHKSNHAAPAPACNITGIQLSSYGSPGSYQITYNADGKPATVQFSEGITSYTRTFSYSAGLIVATTTGSGATTDSVYLNTAGDVDHIVKNPAFSGAVTTTFTYDGNHQLTKSVSQSPGSAPVTSIYKYVNGDLQEADALSLTIKYTYYTDKPSSPTDITALGQWLSYGVIYQRSAHMVQTTSNGNIVQTNTYSYDSNGKIAGATSADNKNSGEAIFTFTYDCH